MKYLVSNITFLKLKIIYIITYSIDQLTYKKTNKDLQISKVFIRIHTYIFLQFMPSNFFDNRIGLTL
jgi:hypothetical protein